MKTFLQLAQDLRQEAGIAGSGPSSFTNQSGDNKRVVDWISKAYRDIQAAHATWQFLQQAGSFNTVAATQTYSVPADFAEWRKESFRLYTTAIGVSDEQLIEYVSWDLFRDNYLIGSIKNQTGRPTIVSFSPDDTCYLWPTPDAVYTTSYEFYRTPYTTVTDTGYPVFPGRFHDILVWRGLMFYGAYSAEPDKYSVGQDEYRKLMRKLEMSQLPDVEWGLPLA